MNPRETILLDLQTKLHNIKPVLPANLPADDHFKDDWNLDSLDLVEFVARIEYQYKISIPDKDLEKFTSINNIIYYLLDRNVNMVR